MEVLCRESREEILIKIFEEIFLINAPPIGSYFIMQ